jgi:hypothetical protein
LSCATGGMTVCQPVFNETPHGFELTLPLAEETAPP